MKIAVVTTTYKRSDGKTPFFLKRALDSVFNQTHNDFKCFVIGDRYADETEFLNIMSPYDGTKLYFENLPIAMERDNYTDKNLIWKYGGCNASNYAINIAVSHGYDYICRIDHDDEWMENHLEVINNVIESKHPLFICTKSFYVGGEILPKIESDDHLIETYPIGAGMVHSSTCVNYGKIPLRQVNLYEEFGRSDKPGDEHFWNILKSYMIENNEIGYCVNLVTCSHYEEQFEKNNLEKYMRKTLNCDFDITDESLEKNKIISNNMEGSTFHFHTHILYDIRTKLGDGDVTYFEIGSYCGASVSLISSHDYPTKCFGLDIGFPIDPSVVIKNVDMFKNKNSTFEYIKGSSYDDSIVQTVYNKVEKIDLLFIDGDHSEQAVYKDFNNYSKLVTKNGYICFDDYLDSEYSPEVKLAVDNIVKSLDANEYEVIGVLEYDQLKSYTNFPANSIFIIKKL